MSDDLRDKYQGEKHLGQASTTPYPASRLAPPIELVDLARQIEGADNLLDISANARLRLIADQIRGLQEEAQRILRDTRRNQQLHHARCSFRRLPGRIYHLYRRTNGELLFMMIGANDWGGTPPHRFIGSYRLENDMSWTAVDASGEPVESDHFVQQEAQREA